MTSRARMEGMERGWSGKYLCRKWEKERSREVGEGRSYPGGTCHNDKPGL